MSRLFTYCIFVFVVVIGLLIGLTNPQLVPLNLFSFQVRIPLSIVISCGLLIGIFFGWLIAQIRIFQLKQQIKQQVKKSNQQQIEMVNKLNGLKVYEQ